MYDQNEKISSFEKAILNDFVVSGDQLDPAFIRLKERWDKRLVPPDFQLLQKESYDAFIETNNMVTDPLLDTVDPVIIGEAQRFIYDALCKFTWSYSNVRQCELDWTLLFDLWRLGPGTSNGVIGTHFCKKIRRRMTCTTKALPLVRLLRRLTPQLHAYDLLKPDVESIVVIRGSRLGAVAKNRKVCRTIAMEPSGNMALQLAAGVYIQGALKRCGIDITTQEGKNKILAFTSSLDGSLCTIDLKSASDLISMSLIKLLWPQSWFSLFNTIRSDECRVDGNWINLNMMSTMGNGFTFPMMTLTLLALIYGYQRSIGLLPHRRVDVSTTGVYGDDIICPTEHFDGIVELLHNLGLKVNTDKSYVSGSFRESCGGDYHQGVEITPFYVESLQDDTEVYVAINKVLRWCSFHEIMLWNTLGYLYSLLSNVYLVPEWEDPSSGILSLYPSKRYKKLHRLAKPMVRAARDPLDALCVVGGYCEPAVAYLYQSDGTVKRVSSKKRHGDCDYIWVSREATYEYVVKNARIPKGFLDGHDPLYSDRVDAEWRAKVIMLLAN